MAEYGYSPVVFNNRHGGQNYEPIERAAYGPAGYRPSLFGPGPFIFLQLEFYFTSVKEFASTFPLFLSLLSLKEWLALVISSYLTTIPPLLLLRKILFCS